MDARGKKCWKEHCAHAFSQDLQSQCTLLQSVTRRRLSVDFLLFSPHGPYPCYKLCTMGASDYKLPLTLCRRNEFFMLIPGEEPLEQGDLLSWYCDVLLSIALYPMENHMAVTAFHSILWGKQPGTDMHGAFLIPPVCLQDPSLSACRLGPLRETDWLQAVLLTEAEISVLLQNGPEGLYDFLRQNPSSADFLSRRFDRKDF